jgi:hypothetical protein
MTDRNLVPNLARVGKAAVAAFLVITQQSEAQVPAQSSDLRRSVPTPEEIIGFAPGTDYKLADYGQITAYFRALAEASDRVILEQIGNSSLGKPMYVAIISNAENLANRARYQEISRRLALARDLSDEEAHRLAVEGKAVVWIDVGLHATEVAHGQHGPVLAHWLATAEDAEARRIRDNVMLLLMVNMNPDGLDIVVDWYNKVVGTPFESRPVPELYHHYVGHDNNRDWYMFTQVEHRAVARQLYHEWFPQLVYNHHQSGPFPGRIWMPPVEDPINPNMDPLVIASLNLIGEAMKRRFTSEGKPGASSGIVYDGWWSGYMSEAAAFHNMIGFITETALYRYATPHCYEADSIPDTFGARADNLPAKRPSPMYPDPWLGGCWHLGDAMGYMLTADRAVLDAAARYRDDWLFNIYKMGARQIDKMRSGDSGPFAYVVDLSAQRDPGRAVEMLRSLRYGGIEIRRAAKGFRVGERSYPAGTYVMPPQAFRPFLADLMDPKDYPEILQYPGGPPDPPYDMTGYELPLVMGVEVDRIEEPFDLPEPEVESPESILVPPGSVRGRGSMAYLIPHDPNLSVRAVNRLQARGATVAWTMDELQAGGSTWPAGTIVASDVERPVVEEIVEAHGLDARALRDLPEVAMARVRAPKIGLYRSWRANMPEGWTRWLLEQYEFDFENLWDEDVRNGDLSDFDVIVLPDQAGEQILHGYLEGTMPEEFAGGVGLEGALALERYVESGGWVVAIDHAVDFAIDMFGLPVRNLARGRRSDEFFVPGSLIHFEFDPVDPLAFGMVKEAIAFFVNSQVLDVIPAAEEGDKKIERDIVAYATFAKEDFLASGWVLGGKRYLAGKTAALRIPFGQGQVVLLAFEPHFRAQSHNTFKLLFNPLHAATLNAGVWRDVLVKKREHERAASHAAP